MKNYDHKKIEKKWQARWEKSGVYRAADKSKKKKFYALIEFPYPSGDGLHVGHVRSYTALDVLARKRRAEGQNVLYPIGWDAFGLPTENYAIKTGIQPAVVTKKNAANFKRQLKSLGLSFDWSREINTTDPKYYKWTQWLFLQFFKHGLAYKAKATINWCPKDKIGLANEEVVGGNCERCGTAVEQRDKEQWMLKITKYADRLDKDLDKVDYLPQVKTQQRNWIGRSEGALIKFDDIEIFTTRPETIYGATFIAMAGKEDKFTGRHVTNPATNEKIPVWEAEYVMGEVGTGAIMGVPAHDERDFDFAEEHNLPITDRPFVDRAEVIKKFGQPKTTYKLRDWVFSRQRYWGEPIPLINCEKCGWQAVPEKDLPVKLPKVKNFLPTENGDSPLSKVEKWVNVKCPKCKGPARRETDVMPNWAGSSWYYLRYADPKNSQEFADVKKLEYWTPVDWYNGGMEHTTLHLLYSRFWHKFLFDQKLVPTDEPYKKRTSHGLILAEGGIKMSKSKGNVINPDDIVYRYGADTLRLYEMFIGPFDQPVAWSEQSIIGPRRFLERVWKLKDKVSKQGSGNTNLEKILNQTIQKVSDDIEQMKFNTAVSALMILLTEMERAEAVTGKQWEIFLQLLSPFAPHVAAELGVDNSHWPEPKLDKTIPQSLTIVVQVDGVVRSSILASRDEDQSQIETRASSNPKIAKWLNQSIKRVVYVPGRLINFVTRDNI